MFSSTMELREASELRMAKNSGWACVDRPRVSTKMNGVTQARASASRQSMANITHRAPMNITTQSAIW